MLDSYTGRSFIQEDGSYDMLPLPCRFHHVLTGLGYKFWRIRDLSSLQPQNYDLNKKQMLVFDKNFFNSRDAVEVHQSAKSFCAHNYAGSWLTNSQTKSIKNMLPKWFLKIVYTIGQRTWGRKKFSWYQIPFEN